MVPVHNKCIIVPRYTVTAALQGRPAQVAVLDLHCTHLVVHDSPTTAHPVSPRVPIESQVRAGAEESAGAAMQAKDAGRKAPWWEVAAKVSVSGVG